MTREFDQKGFTAVQITALPTISKRMGVNRIVEGIGIPYPLGDPALALDAELDLRTRILMAAMDALETEVTGPTVFKAQ